MILAENGVVESSHLPAHVSDKMRSTEINRVRTGLTAAKRRVGEDFERRYIRTCLKTTNGNISQAARVAQIDVKNFHVKMRKYRIEAHDFKVRARAVDDVSVRD